MEFHPIFEIFPLMNEPELAVLAEDIKVHGLREPIWLHPDGRILDGRSRHAVGPCC
jgi:ParB-like chromosome segregation protein Spo0J